ncbi:unnamed protein product [Tilletia controversa]|nr:unnamed protein product [Tilletia controversa]CAD6963724.1 unnamed protein product [Tilletia controversa]
MESSMELNDPPHQDLRRRLSNPDLNDLRATAASMDLSDLPHRDLRRRLSNPGLIDLRATAASMDLSDPPHRDLRRGSSKHSKRVVHHPSNRAGLTKSSLP